MEDAAKKYAAENGVDLIIGQGHFATDIEGQIALIRSGGDSGVQGIAITPCRSDRRAGARQGGPPPALARWCSSTTASRAGRARRRWCRPSTSMAGKIAGEYLKTVLKDGDKIGILEGVPACRPSTTASTACWKDWAA